MVANTLPPPTLPPATATPEVLATAVPTLAPTDTAVPPPPPEPQPGCVNLNTASYEDLQLIIHIGPERAQEIINRRPWSSVNQLTIISGIGPARMADILAQGLACV
ncbi:MAG: hypothetical protein HC804_02380 [Anaerolineae bacterium]|nr:hypothetical protein [Anaerolineae bacterium]